MISLFAISTSAFAAKGEKEATFGQQEEGATCVARSDASAKSVKQHVAEYEAKVKANSAK